MSELQEILAARGYQSRPAQERLFTHLTQGHPTGVIAQAGTGTGKSMAILASAANAARRTGDQSIIVTPTLTLMNQYRDGDTPWAIEAFDDLAFAEVRGMRHYYCAQSVAFQGALDIEHVGGCLGGDGECSQKGWEGHDDHCMDGCDILHDGGRWECGYREARYLAKHADVVVTNADMLIVNDRTLTQFGAEFMSLGGSLFVDEAHTLEQKLRDYASRSLHWSSIERFKFADPAAVKNLAGWLKNCDLNLALKDIRTFEAQLPRLREIAYATVPERDGEGKKTTKQQETQEAAERIVRFLDEPHENAVAHVNQGAIKYDWINVSKSAGELLSTRRFGLVSATVPKTMAAALGVPDAPFTDVGHPFDYANQAWLGFSSYGGDYKSAQGATNFEVRTKEVMDLITRAKGGALLLFSSFRDMEAVADRLGPQIKGLGLNYWVQDREMEPSDRQALADKFKADGNGVLFGSESFATGFDVPGDALRLVVVWKLPYPAVDPVSNAIRSQSFPRYNDIMKVRAVQAIGRLIRTDTDRGIVWIADNRGRRLIDPTDPLTAHIPEFARL